MRPLIAVHGFQMDPKDVGGRYDPARFYAAIEGLAGRDVVGFGWYSAPFGFEPLRPVRSLWRSARAWLAAWAALTLNPYHHAWKLAVGAADDLVQAVEAIPGPVDIVCHSLGARVVLTALPRISAKVRRVVIFNGAELSRNATALAALTDAKILNMCVSSDLVLALLGSHFSGDGEGGCVGLVGLMDPLPNWRDLYLDDLTICRRARGRGWFLRGDDPSDLLDHGETFRFAGNAALVRAWLDDDDLADLFA